MLRDELQVIRTAAQKVLTLSALVRVSPRRFAVQQVYDTRT